MQRLICGVQNYHWGKVGADSLVAQLGLKGGHIDAIDDEVTYAELWMGTHPNNPSIISELVNPDSPLIQKQSDHAMVIYDSRLTIYCTYMIPSLTIARPFSKFV